MKRYRLRWRDYRPASGRRPVKAFIDQLASTDRAAVVAAMKEVATEGLAQARHLRGEIYEVRAVGVKAHYRLLFSQETKFVLLALEIFDKDTQSTPPRILELAEQRLKDWRARGNI